MAVSAEPAPVTISAEQAAALLGVRLQTVYSYVSRGRLTRARRIDRHGHRVSVFDLAQVQALTERRRAGLAALEPRIDTGVTMLSPSGELLYRGQDAVALAGRWRFERVAELLWGEGTVRPPDAGTHAAPDDCEAAWAAGSSDDPPWYLESELAEAVRRAAEALPATARDADRMRAGLVALAAAAPERDVVGAEAVRAVGRRAVTGCLHSLPVRGPHPGGTGSAANLWSRIGTRPAALGEVRVLDAALSLLADHELAASTRAVRVAASTLADPYLVLLTGLAAMGGPLHGSSSVAAEATLRAYLAGDPSAYHNASPAGPNGWTPGFGHAVYRGPDPRADRLLGLLEPLRPSLTRAVADLALSQARRHGRAPNVDLALGALVLACDLHPGSGETVFGLARLAGWTAHAIEAYPYGLRHRPRALYSGAEPRSR